MKTRCSATVFGDRVQHWQCTRTGVVTRKGKWYCRQHDPEAVAARRRAAEDGYKARQREQDEIVATANEIASRLGCGYVLYETRPKLADSGFRRRLVITFEDAENLIRRLDRPRR